MREPISVTVNGEPRQTWQGASVADLLTELAVEPRAVAVERNHEIVPRSTYAAVTLAPGDRLEIVQFVGGG